MRTLVFLFFSLSVYLQEVVPPLPVSKNKFIVISHRGNHVHVPENTVAAVTEAIRAGADYVEIDLRTTKDGFLVLSHDATVGRMTDGKGNVKDLTLAEIKGLRIVGPALDGTRDSVLYCIPEFAAVLAACKGKINIYLDFKDADVAESWRQIRAAGMEKSVVVYLNKESQYGDWRRVAPAMPLMSSVPRGVKTAEQLEHFLATTRLEVLDNVYDSTLLPLVRAKGVAVWLDVEGPGESDSLWRATIVGKGIQGVQTDHPDALIGWLKDIGLPRSL
jgi:glycerophosphoryl diester phosphodiesterase